jgi:surface polysaccharide O-acyltransferase-like enzyme
MSAQQEKLTWVNNLRGLSIIMIVVSHSVNRWLPLYDTLNGFDWWFLNLAAALNRFCVPIFLMVSGAMLFQRKNEAIPFYKKRIKKVFIPFFVWSTVYTALFFAHDLYLGQIASGKDALRFIGNSYLFGAAYHLWYFYLLFALYLFVPYASQLFRYSTKFLKAYVAVWFAVLLLAQFSDAAVFYYLRWVLGYFGLMVFGYFLYRYAYSGLSMQRLGIVLFIIGLVSTMCGGYYSITQQSKDYFEWYYRLNINIVLLSSGLFLWMMNSSYKSKLLNALSSNGLGIYLSHVLFIMLLNDIFPQPSFMSLPIYMLLFVAAAATMSYLCIVLLRRVPWLGKYIM